jgi:MFS-type transporter involved in bile tolerance (Atg22 family)
VSWSTLPGTEADRAAHPRAVDAAVPVGFFEPEGTGGTNTVVAIFVQARVARWVSSYLRATQAQRLAGIALALCCGCLAGSALPGTAVASAVLLIAGVLCLSAGELLTVSSAWEVSFRLAPDGRSAEFFATYGLGRAGSQVVGPIIITVAVLALGVPGWLSLAALFILGGLITPLMAQSALEHTLVLRRPPADSPTDVRIGAATSVLA